MTLDADTLNRLGMIVGFVSFWLLVPEFLNENVLLNYAELAADVFRLLLVLLIGWYVLLGFYYFFSGLLLLWSAAETQPQTVAIRFFEAAIAFLFTRVAVYVGLTNSRDPYLKRVSDQSAAGTGISDASLGLMLNVMMVNAVGFTLIFVAVDVVRNNRLLGSALTTLAQGTAHLVGPTAIALALVVVSPRILAKLHDVPGRLFLFYLGASLFTIGFVLQLLATYLPS